MNSLSRKRGNDSGWLARLQQRLKSKRRRSAKARQQPVLSLENLEQRALLSATGSLIGNELVIITDANESVSIAQDMNDTNLAQVLINGGTVDSLPPIALTSIQSISIQTGELDNTVDLTGLTAVAFTNLTSIRVETGNGSDTINLSDEFSAEVFSGDGDDTINSLAGADTINSGNGDDLILGGDGADVIDAGDGNDSVQGDGGSDDIQAGDGDDTVSGGDGNDTILGHDGTDSLLGDAGQDSIIGDLGNDVIFGGADNDILLGGGGNDDVSGDDGDDIMNGSGGDDVLSGQAGADVIFGKAGRDTIQGGDGTDFIKGGNGNDSLLGNNSGDTIFGGAGNDALFGDSSDPLSAEIGNDQLFGESGRDTLVGSRGADQLDGGDGNDLIRSTNELNAINVIPPPAPPTVPTAGMLQTAVSGILNDATTFSFNNVGPQNSMATGIGDGSVFLTVDAVGNFGAVSPTFSGANFDPLGPFGTDRTVFDSGVYFRGGATGPRTRLNTVATGISDISGDNDESNSVFTIGTLSFDLDQTLTPIMGPGGTQTGSLLTQTYRISNLDLMNPATFELVRYLDGDLNYANSAGDGAGRLTAISGEELLFITDEAGDAGSPSTFLVATGIGGNAVPAGRFQGSPAPGLLGAVLAGTALTDSITNDIDGNSFADAGLEYDAAVAFQNTFTLGPFQTETYTTHTVFGSGSPSVAATNMSPSAVDDFVLLPTGGVTGTTITIDVTANDSDVDGAIDPTSVVITNPPMNGVAVNLGNGLIEYTSNAGFIGMDTFDYSVSDNAGVSSTATVSIAVVDTDAIGDTLSGGAGVDTIIGQNGDDLIDGGNNGDIISAGGGDDLVYGGGGNDSVLGEEGRDTLVGNGGTDTLNGGDDDDTIVYRSSKDFRVTVESSGGQDALVVQGDRTSNNVTIQTVGSDLVVTEGNAQLTIDATIQNITVNLGSGDDTLTMLDMSAVDLNAIGINGEVGNDTIDLSAATRNGSLFIRADGGEGNDFIVGSSFGESLVGGAGDDVINAGDGDDELDGGDGNDQLTGEAGDDTLTGGDGNDQLTGNDGDDSIVGGVGNDIINGDAGNDTLRGNFGDDFLNGSTGNDFVSAGLGRDAVVGGAGADTLDGGHNDDIIVGNAGNDLILASNGNDLVNGGAGNDTLNGGDGDDTLLGDAGDDLIGGFDGEDFISGDAGNDTMTGGDGNDTVLGGSQNDIALGDEGDDAVNGGGGIDVGAQGDGVDVPLMRIEDQDEAFVLSADLLAELNGQL